jgi:hypothetical protein
LNKTAYYGLSKEEWSIPEFPASTLDVVGPLSEILPTIVAFFVKPSHPGVVREVCTTMGAAAAEEDNDDGYRTLPFLVLKASGPSFQMPVPDEDGYEEPGDEEAADIGFSNIATCFLVNTEPKSGEEEGEMEIMEELASYSRCVSCSRSPASPTYLEAGGHFEIDPTDCMSGRSPLPRTTFVSCTSTALEPRSPHESTYTETPRHLFGWSLACRRQTWLRW